MKKIILVAGEPNSINTEIIYKSWKKIDINLKKKIYFIANYKLIADQLKSLNYKIKLKKVININQYSNESFFKILDIDINYKNLSELTQKKVDKFIIESLSLAHKLGLKKNVKGIINCPINKSHLDNRFYGVTEFFASKCLVKDNSEAMLIRSNKFSVAPITTHIDIKDISRRLNSELIVKKIKTINLNFKKLFKKKPKIAILGLNPHNAEFKTGSEEKKIILPSLKKLKKTNINLYGPFAADSLFISNFKKYDVVVGMYHDQIITPFKTLYKFNAINVTLGLKYLRASPDHGTASDLIGKKIANPTSLIECINFIEKYGK